jgi:hypothetical protein
MSFQARYVPLRSTRRKYGDMDACDVLAVKRGR